MKRKTLFNNFIKICEDNDQICGLGNPDAYILLIGQEHFAPGEVNWKSELQKNYAICRGYDSNSDFIKPKGDEDANGKLLRRNPTWCNYQKLLDLIYGRKSGQPNKLDFERYAFTTELNSIPKSSNKTKDKQEKQEVEKRVLERLKLLRESEFINKSFPVVVLACGRYIKNQGEGDERQIDNTFCVEYDGDEIGRYSKENRKEYSIGNWFYTHHNKVDNKYFKAGEKLVIHTRQLSGAINEELYEDMAVIIREHLHTLGLL